MSTYAKVLVEHRFVTNPTERKYVNAPIRMGRAGLEPAPYGL